MSNYKNATIADPCFLRWIPVCFHVSKGEKAVAGARAILQHVLQEIQLRVILQPTKSKQARQKPKMVHNHSEGWGGWPADRKYTLPPVLLPSIIRGWEYAKRRKKHHFLPKVHIHIILISLRDPLFGSRHYLPRALDPRHADVQAAFYTVF
jgi:hypothetical protein